MFALITAVTIASTSAPPNWNDVFSNPPARPCSSAGDPTRSRDVQRAEREREADPGEQERRQHRERVARVEPDRQEEHVAGRDRDQPCDDQPWSIPNRPISEAIRGETQRHE